MRCQLSTRRWKILATAGLLTFPLFLPAVPGLAPAGEPVLTDYFPLPAPWSVGATPDCGDLPPEPHPEAQRTRLLARLGVDRWHMDGYRGHGIKIAILDSGFRGYRTHLGGPLPAEIVAHSFRGDHNLEAKNSQHGILCAEVLHALAPEAELLFANWEPDHPEQFLDAVRWARKQGVRILSCSLIMPSWSDGEGGGPMHEQLAHLLGPGGGPNDMLCFASAGNTAERHWHGPFHAGSDGCHEWDAGHTDNVLTPWENEQISVEMCWQPGADYDLTVLDDFTGQEVGGSRARPGLDRCCAVARFLPRPYHKYDVRVRCADGRPGTFHLVTLGGGLHYVTARGSIAFPADGPEVIAVGAVNGNGRRAGYSSCGPNSHQPKPDLVAVVPFPSFWRPRPFTGTSAAAPQAAGLAALCLCRHPEWTAERVRRALQAAAEDLGQPGHDCETGYGLIRLP